MSRYLTGNRLIDHGLINAIMMNIIFLVSSFHRASVGTACIQEILDLAVDYKQSPVSSTIETNGSCSVNPIGSTNAKSGYLTRDAPLKRISGRSSPRSNPIEDKSKKPSNIFPSKSSQRVHSSETRVASGVTWDVLAVFLLWRHHCERTQAKRNKDDSLQGKQHPSKRQVERVQWKTGSPHGTKVDSKLGVPRNSPSVQINRFSPRCPIKVSPVHQAFVCYPSSYIERKGRSFFFRSRQALLSTPSPIMSARKKWQGFGPHLPHNIAGIVHSKHESDQRITPNYLHVRKNKQRTMYPFPKRSYRKIQMKV